MAKYYLAYDKLNSGASPVSLDAASINDVNYLGKYGDKSKYEIKEFNVDPIYYRSGTLTGIYDATGPIQSGGTTLFTPEQISQYYQNKAKSLGYSQITADEYSGWQKAYSDLGIKQYGRPTTAEAQSALTAGQDFVSKYLANLNQQINTNASQPTISREQYQQVFTDATEQAQAKFAADPANAQYLNLQNQGIQITEVPKTNLFMGQTQQAQTPYGQIINVNGQNISPQDPNYAAYYKQQYGSIPSTTGTAQTGLPAAGAGNVNLRKLGPTEYNNLVNEWRKAGLTDQQIEQNFLSRQGNDIYLRTDAPSTQSILAGSKTGGTSGGMTGGMTGGQMSGATIDQDQATNRAMALSSVPTLAGKVSGADTSVDWNKLNQEITQIQTEIADRQAFYDKEEQFIKSQQKSQRIIDLELSKLAQQKNAEMADLQVRESIATGNFERARQVVQQQFQNDMALDQRTIGLLSDGFMPLTDELASQLDPTQYIELSDGTKWLKNTAGTALDFSTVDNWAKNVMDGVANLSNVPDEVRGAVSDRVRELVDSGYTALTPNQKENLMKMVTQVKTDPGYRDMLDVANGYNTVKAGYDASGNFGDLAMINGFQRMIDPGAVVREGEFKTVGEAQGITGRLQLWLGLGGASVWAGDKLTIEARNKLMAVANSLYNEKAKFYSSQTGAQYQGLAAAMGVDPKLVMKEFPQDNVAIDNNIYNIFSDQVAPEVQARIDNIASIFMIE